ncbi:unnamed protein product [Gadus morhua 'NCC']
MNPLLSAARRFAEDGGVSSLSTKTNDNTNTNTNTKTKTKTKTRTNTITSTNSSSTTSNRRPITSTRSIISISNRGPGPLYSDQLQEPSGTDRPRTALTEEAKHRLSEEVSDTILAHNKARFTGHLVSATLVQGTMFERYCH